VVDRALATNSILLPILQKNSIVKSILWRIYSCSSIDKAETKKKHPFYQRERKALWFKLKIIQKLLVIDASKQQVSLNYERFTKFVKHFRYMVYTHNTYMVTFACTMKL